MGAIEAVARARHRSTGRSSAVRRALVAAVDDWAVCAADKAQRGWLLGGGATYSPTQLRTARASALSTRAAWEDLPALSRTGPDCARSGASLASLLAGARGTAEGRARWGCGPFHAAGRREREHPRGLSGPT